MQRLLALALVAALSSAAFAASTATARPAAPQASGKFVVVFQKPQNEDEAFLVELLKAARLRDVFAEFSKVLILPRNITISVRRGDEGPYYNPATRTIVLNHDFSALGLRVFMQEYPKITPYRLGVLFGSLVYFVLFHELGHALIDQWQLPVIGREEDGVDGFSTVLLTEFVPDSGGLSGGQIALAGADFFNYLGQKQQLSKLDFADEHSLNLQRVYNIVCWVYGSDTARWQSLTSLLPKSRRVRCPAEYKQLLNSWKSLLKPHIRKS